ncbi:MAG: PHP domain-containing protein [Mogibacterium sp.]|nr:PHP domain-containing protein [Mogibacterium sp.]
MKLYKEYDRHSIRAIIESGLKRDLHMHTNFSDGTQSPEKLLKLRMEQGYEMLAITDHDGIDGSVIGEKFAEKTGLCYIAGIEFDSEDPLGKDLHILGYGYDKNNKDFREALLEIRIKRARRNDLLMKALNDRGYNITLDDVGSINKGRYVGKPTFAYILYLNGYTHNPNEAFKTIFQDEDIKGIKKETLSSKDVVDIIHTAGGMAVMAHPMEQRKAGESFEDFKPRMYQIMDRMREYGIDGIECYHPSASPEQSELLVEYADRHSLMITEGSDVHSPNHLRDYSRYHLP